MVWKILSGISAAALAAACYFAWANQQDLKQERDMLARAKENLAELRSRQKEAEDTLANKKTQLANLEKERDETKEQVAKTAAEAQEKEAALALNKNNLDQVTVQVETLQKKIEEAGDIKKLVAQVEALKKDQESAEGALANQVQHLAQTQEQVKSLQDQIVKYRDAEVRARKGVVEPTFTARVAQFFPEWGFAILNKGNSGGVFANADLEVKRGKDVVAKLKVRNVEPNISVADVIPGSVAEGNTLRSGDMVVAAAEQAAAKDVSTPTPTTGAPQAPTGTPQAPAPPQAPMNSDPFGAPAGGAPAPAPAAPMNSDPFAAPAGAAPAPAAPMNSDPFAAPAGGATPAPAPSNADPFATAPPAGATPAK